MRILQIRFKNLNSLVGEWLIDLTNPAFASDGIFAITGPTGAGKSTILDAICLALYGRTPRLNKITKSSNEVMSRQTGECFAEVKFETQAGRFLCTWGQRRARKKYDGELQAPTHEIANADSGAIFESKLKDVANQIEIATGMDFYRFTRSMLLAQGGFAAFLQAGADERAPILEQITGTEIYSKISIRVHERHREERQNLKLLEAETTSIALLEPEQEVEMLQTLDARQKEELKLEEDLRDTRAAISWLTGIDTLKQEISSQKDEASLLELDIETFKPDQTKLIQANRAASLDGIYATLSAFRTQLTENRENLLREEKTIPELEKAVTAQSELLKLAEEKTAQLKEEQGVNAPIIQKVRILDQKLSSQEQMLSELRESLEKAEKQLGTTQQNKFQENKKYLEAQQTLKLVENYLQEQAQDEWLISGFTGIEEQLHNLRNQQQEILQEEAKEEKCLKELETATQSLSKHQDQSCGLKQKLSEASEKLQQEKTELNHLLGHKLLREYRAEKETLFREKAFLDKIAELEAHRVKLEDGTPCPLCGAKEHPFAEGNVPIPDEIDLKIAALTEIINQAEKLELVIKQREESEATAHKNLSECEKQETVAKLEKMAAEKSLSDSRGSLKKLRTEFTEREKTISEKLLPIGITEIPDNNVFSLIESLKTRRSEWQNQVQKKAAIEKLLTEIESEIKRLDAVIETQSNAINEKKEQLETSENTYTAGNTERQELYGDKNPDDEERRLNSSISDAEKIQQTTQIVHTELHQKWLTAKSHIDSLLKNIEKKEPDLQNMESEFLKKLESNGFSYEEQFLKARLSPELKESLEVKAQELDERKADLKARQKDRKIRLETELDRKVTDLSLNELKPQLNVYEDALRGLQDIISSLKHKLSENIAAKEKLSAKQLVIEAQKEECRRWDNLHELIGSGDGKKYRNFAQGLTFDIMVTHANHQLQKMTDRYLLVRDNAQPLDLNVVDNYQAGETRSTKNLSGGESFIVSLSLALGLSQMSSQNVRVDSLFLDEGFGTLDEEALDTALETLAGLQQDGKLIGIISHVSVLKERITTQIQVTPQTGGKSKISGPGCRKSG